MLPEANKELERFNVRIMATYPFPAQVLFCREPIASLADLKGKKVRTDGGSLNDLVKSIGAPAGRHRLSGSLQRARARRRRLRHHRHGVRQRRALVRGDEVPLHAAGGVVDVGLLS